ncbi:MAG: SH3 domain-containing protein [Anaerolineae bacterium]|nr:SH3 domain-containing protein [Anaerolineae bacterium]
MLHRRKPHILTLTLVLASAILAAALPAAAQDDACAALVESALAAAASACADLEADQACYGSPSVAVETPENLSVVFEKPGDTAALGALQAVVSAPLDPDAETWGLAVLRPILEGQPAVFLLMGGVSMKSLATAEAAPEVTPVAATTVGNTNVNLRNAPSATNTTVVATLAPNTPINLIGVNAAGDWYQLEREGSKPWVWKQLIVINDPEAAARLPVTEPGTITAPPGPGPAAAFTFNTPSTPPACDAAANALVVQSGGTEPASFKIGETAINLDGTAVFVHSGDSVPGEGVGASLLIVFLVEGRLDTVVGDMDIALREPGETLSVTLDVTGGEGRLGADAGLMTPDADQAAPGAAYACRNAAASGLLLRELDPADCAAETAYLYTITAANDLDYPVVLWIDGEIAVPFDAMETKTFPIAGGRHDFQVCNEGVEAGSETGCGETDPYNTGRLIDENKTWLGWLPQ